MPLLRQLRWPLLLVCFSAAACSGSLNCGGCVPGGLAPIPGGFPANAKIDRGAELRLSQSGLDFIGREFADLVGAYAKMACGPGEAVACPTSFVVGGQPRPTTCGPRATCIDPSTSKTEPVLGFQIDRTVSSGAIVCRDEATDPNPRSCFAWLRLEGLSMHPVAPNQLEATVTAQIYTTVIPLRYDPLGMDCIVTLNSNSSGAGTQDFVIHTEIGEWTPPAGGEGRQLQVTVSSVDGMIPDGDLTIARDPVHGDFGDVLTCGIANLGTIKNAIVGRLVGRLGEIIDDQIQQVLAWKCGHAGDLACPAGTSCNADGRCEEDQTNKIVPQRIGADGRIDFSQLIASFGGHTAGSGDVSFLVGGTSATDMGGASIGLLAGMETGVADDRCSLPSLSPRLRPGFAAPPPFPTVSQVDLDFDGTPERSFMIGAGLSQQLLDQLIWSIYRSGLFCLAISSYDVKLINTGSLSVLMPSLAQLTHSDKYPWSVWPARIALRPIGEPTLTIGEGKTRGMPPNVSLESPLLNLKLPNLQLDFSAMIEERWVHLMTVNADVDVPVGLYAGGTGDLEIVIGDLAQAITNIHVTGNEILAEDATELEMSVPALLSLVLPQLTSALAQPISLPSGRDLGGFTPTVLGVRGVPKTGGGFSHVGVYLDLAFDPALAPALRVAADTRARVLRFEVPSSEEMSIQHPGGPRVPHLELALEGEGPADAVLEYQVQIDGGSWSPFVLGPVLSLERAELLVQGVHQVAIRARGIDDPRSLDPSPTVLSLVVDTEPPVLRAEVLATRAGALVRAQDVVSGDRLRLEVLVDGVARTVTLDERDAVLIPELEDGDRQVVLRATDEVGLASTVLLQKGVGTAIGAATAVASSSGCRCVAGGSDAGASVAVIGAMLFFLGRRRRSAR